MAHGILMAVLLFALMLPVIAASAWYAKRRYARAVSRLQADDPPLGRSVGHADAACTDPIVSGAIPPSLSLAIQRSDSVHEANAVSENAQRLRRHVLLVQFGSASVYWWLVLVLMAAHAILGSGGNVDTLLIIPWFVGPTIVLLFVVPPAVAWVLQAGVSRTLMNLTVSGVVLVASALMLNASHWDSMDGLGFVFGYCTIAIVASAFMRPSFRGAGVPLAAAGGVAVLVLAAMAALIVVLDDSPADVDLSNAELVAGTIFLLTLLAVAAGCGWLTLRLIAKGYAAKRFSDLQFTVATYWVLVTAFALGSVARDAGSSTLFLVYPERPRTWPSVLEPFLPALFIAGIVITWLAFRGLQSAALARLVRRVPPRGSTLLFLRVFKHSNRSETFMDRFLGYWRFAGSVWMVAGPDLAGAYMEPNEFFDYITGRLRDHFVARPDEARPRVDRMDTGRDPDGRFRVNEVYCTSDSWRPTVLLMIERADAVLLDLREYTARRAGTRYELTELLRSRALHKSVILIDQNDDVSRLSQEIDALAREVAARGMDDRDAPSVRILTFGKGTDAEMRGLFHAVAQAAGSRRMNPGPQ